MKPNSRKKLRAPARPRLLEAAARPTLLGSTIFDLPRLPLQRTPHGEFRPIVDAPTPTFERVEMHVTRLKPGVSSHLPHHHPQEELLVIGDGTVESWINGQRERVGAGSVVFFAAHDVHGLANVGAAPATYYVINFYTAATAVVRDQPAAEQARPHRLHSTVIDWARLKPRRSAVGLRRRLVDSPTLTFARLKIYALTLNAGAAAGMARRHPWAQIVIVKSGVIAVTINGVTRRVRAGSLAYIAAQDRQSIRNAGRAPATFFVLAVRSAASSKGAK